MEAWFVGIVIAAVAGWNVLHMAPGRWRDVVVSLGVGAVGVAGTIWLFTAVDPERGLSTAWMWTAVAAVISGSVVVAGHLFPSVARAISDRRINDMSNGGFVAYAFLRIPLLTALTEEVLFRGVVWILLSRIGGSTMAWIGSTVAFALAHVAVAVQQARREGYPIVRWLAGTLFTTGAAGLGLGWLRLWTGGIWASVGVHAVVNVVFALGARSVASKADTESRRVEAASR